MIGFLMPLMAMAEVQTEVRMAGDASYFYEEHHPVKFDFKSFTMCWGKHSQTEADSSKGEDLVIRGSQGSQNLMSRINGGRSRFDEVKNQSLDWQSEFDRSDYSFNINIKKRVGNSQTLVQRNTCSTRTWNYRIDRATSRVESSLSLLVPDNVYILEIEKLQQGNLPSLTSFVAEKVYVGDESTGQMEIRQMETVQIGRNINFYFVKPGDEIKLKTVFADQGSNVDLMASLKVTFFGHNRCDKIIDDAIKNSGGGDGIDQHLIERYFDVNFGRRQDGSILEEESREALNVLGCLTSPKVIEDLLYRQNIVEIKGILDSILKLSVIQDTKRLQLFSETREVSDLYLFLSAAEKMARQAVSQSVLNAMGPMCELVPVFNPGGKNYTVTTYLHIKVLLERISILLNKSESGESQFADVYGQFAEQLARLPFRTYSEFSEGDVKKVMEIFSWFVNSNKMIVVNQMMEYINRIPTDVPQTAELNRFEMAASDLFRTTEAFQIEVTRYAMDVGKRSDREIDIKTILKLSEEVSSATTEFVEALAVYQRQFSGRLAREFANSVRVVYGVHFTNTDDDLRDLFGGFFKTFGEFYRDPSGKTLDLDHFHRCFTEPIQGANP